MRGFPRHEIFLLTGLHIQVIYSSLAKAPSPSLDKGENRCVKTTNILMFPPVAILLRNRLKHRLHQSWNLAGHDNVFFKPWGFQFCFKEHTYPRNLVSLFYNRRSDLADLAELVFWNFACLLVLSISALPELGSLMFKEVSSLNMLIWLHPAYQGAVRSIDIILF